MPTISVIVPVYKVEKYIRECVDSILSQTFTDFELILVDDGSPDNCGAICDEYAEKDSRIKVIHQKNGGLSAARNAGIDIANGQYITFVDSDDMISKDYLRRLYAAITAENADVSICALQRFVELPELDNLADSDLEVITGREACYRLYEDDGVKYTVAWAKLYKSFLLEKIRFPVGRLHEDEATTYKALYAAKNVAVLSEKLYYYRINPNSIMNSHFSAKRYDAITAFKERAKFYADRGENELCKLTEKTIYINIAKLCVFAKHDGSEDVIPDEYKISEREALKILRTELSDDRFTWYLAQVHPNWLKPHAYIRKIKKMLHIPCK